MKKMCIAVIAICFAAASAFWIAGAASRGSTKTAPDIPRGTAESVQTVQFGESYRMPFDLDAFINGSFDGDRFTPTAFRGIVTNIKCEELTWTNGSGEKSGPYFRTILDVTVDEDYRGNLPGGEIKALIVGLLPNNTSVKVGGEYVFLCSWLLDSVYFDTIMEKTPDNYKNDTSLQEADVIVGSEWCSIFPIRSGFVSLYNEYLDRIDHSYERDGEAYLVPENEFASVYKRILDSVEG